VFEASKIVSSLRRHGNNILHGALSRWVHSASPVFVSRAGKSSDIRRARHSGAG